MEHRVATLASLAKREGWTRMKSFDIYNTAKRSRKPVAQLFYDAAKNKMKIVVGQDVSSDDLPLMLALFVEKGKRTIPDKWARKWVEERVPPQGRQNLGEILRANGLDTYDEIALLEAAQGRSSQDDFLLCPTSVPNYEYAIMDMPQESEGGDESECAARSWCAVVGPKIASYRKSLGLTQRELSEKTGIDQAAISRIESGRANPTINTLDTLAEAVGASLLVKII